MVTDASVKAGAREWWGLAVLTLPTLVLAMDMTVLYLALPAITAELRPSSSQMLWILHIYGFLIAGFLITMGRLGERIGRRRLLLMGAAGFGLASILAANSTSAEMLIASRALLGFTGATLMPSTLSLLRTLFLDPDQRKVAISVWMTSFSAGAALGPVVGGVLLEYFWWGSVFLLGIPATALLLCVGPLVLREYRAPDAGRLDIPSVVLSLIATIGIIGGLQDIVERGLTWQSLGVIGIGAALAAAFARRQRALDDPLLDTRLFGYRAFSAALLALLLIQFVLGGSRLFFTQHLQSVLGLSPLQAGFWAIPSALAIVVGTMTAPVLARRVRPAYIMASGLTIAGLGFAISSQVGWLPGLPILVSGIILASLGVGPAMVLSSSMVVSTAPPERAGSASAMLETSAEFGRALGMALLGSVGMAVYRTGMAGSVPSGVPTAEHQSVLDSVGGAVGVADRLSGTVREELLSAAHASFTWGVQVSMAAAALFALGAAVLVFAVLRNVDPDAAGGDEEEGADATPETSGDKTAMTGEEPSERSSPEESAAPERECACSCES